MQGDIASIAIKEARENLLQVLKGDPPLKNPEKEPIKPDSWHTA
jgi:hypothetical protein